MFNAELYRADVVARENAWAAHQVRNLPDRFQRKLLAIREKKNEAGYYAGNDFIREVAGKYEFPLPIAASNDELIAYASARADECFRLAGYYKQAGAALGAMQKLCDRLGVKMPGEKTEAGQLARLVCPLWWRRAVRKAAGRAIEKTAISLGLVHRRAGIYASDETVRRRGQQKRRNRALLESLIAVNEAGQEFTLQELSDLGISNPAIRRGELMTRISGFETIAATMGHAGEFYTITAPSRFHARLSKTVEANPKYTNRTPREAQAYLRKVWARIRSALRREKIAPYGFRVVEAHHDGTPHWHALFFMPSEQVARAREIVRKYAIKEDREELGADVSPRFKAVAIDRSRGTAAGYIAKYIAKNIDGENVGQDLEGQDAKAAAARVDAWAACWGIRQFQQIGGAPVSVWRELRRLEAGASDSAIDRAARAADAGDWAGFLRAMEQGQVRVWRKEAERTGRYGDTVLNVAGVVDRTTGEQIETRSHVWEIKRGGMPGGDKLEAGTSETDKSASRAASFGFDVGPILAPWSSVNNCTRGGGKDGNAGGEEGNGIGKGEICIDAGADQIPIGGGDEAAFFGAGRDHRENGKNREWRAL